LQVDLCALHHLVRQLLYRLRKLIALQPLLDPGRVGLSLEDLLLLDQRLMLLSQHLMMLSKRLMKLAEHGLLSILQDAPIAPVIPSIWSSTSRSTARCSGVIFSRRLALSVAAFWRA
jgi:hypothetical protein